MSTRNREVLKSALSEFSMAINQAVLNLTLNLHQGGQQQQAHAESAQRGCPSKEGGPTKPSTSKGTRELRSKRKHDDLEEPIGELRSDEEESSSTDKELEDYGDSESSDEDGDEVDENSGDGVGGCNTRFKKGHKRSNHIRARIKSHIYTTE